MDDQETEVFETKPTPKIVPGTPGGEIISGIISIMDGFGFKHNPNMKDASDLIDNNLGSLEDNCLNPQHSEIAQRVGDIIWAPRHDGDKCPKGMLAAIASCIRMKIN